MADNDFYEFNLSSEIKDQSLKLSLSDKKISFILENKSQPHERYSTLLNLTQLSKLSKAFENLNSLEEALLIISQAIESGNIFLVEQDNFVNLKLKIKEGKEESPPFYIKLLLQKGQTVKQVQQNIKPEFDVLPVKFDYQGNKEAEEKYGTTTKNTTEYNKPIINTDYKKPILQLEYIEPILQVHYPDGSIKSKALPPRIQSTDGTQPNISEEQFKYIREQMNRSTGKGFGVNSVENGSHYSTSSVPVSTYNNIINSFNYGDNTNNNQTEMPQIQSQSQIQTQNSSQYSTKSVSNKPIYQGQPQEFYNRTNVQNRSPPRNKTIEYAPRMIQQNQSVNKNYSYTNNNNFNQYQNVTSRAQINTQVKKNISSNKYTGFAKVIPLKQIKRPTAQSVILQQKIPMQISQQKIPMQISQQKIPMQISQQRPQMIQQQSQNEMPYEYNSQQQRERFQNQLRIQKQIIEAKTPKFPKVLPTQIMDTKFEYPQGRHYEEEIISKIKAEDQPLPSYLTNTQYNQDFQTEQINETKQSIQEQVLPIIYQQNNKEGNIDFSSQMEQQLQNYNEENINKMNDMKVQTNENENNNEEVQNEEENDIREETLGNNEVIEDNENNNEEGEEGEEQNQNEEEDYEALYKTEDGYIIFRNGILRGIIHRYSEIDEIISRIQDKLSKGAKFNLLYKAFSDGDKASTFHKKCDKHPLTLVLIETTEGVRFGGFSKQSWEGKCLKKIDNDAFVFSIDTGKCFDIKKNEPAIGCYPKFGPVFFGCQIRIYDDFFTKGGTTCLRGLNYNTEKDYELNNGERNFIVKDIEVYEIEAIDI